MGEHAECAIATVSLPTLTPSCLPSSPRHTHNSYVCSSHALCTGRGGRRRCAGRGGSLGWVQRGRGASPSAIGVVRCFPDPSRPPQSHCLAPSPFPNLLGLRAAHSPSPSATRGCPLPGLRMGLSTLALHHWGHALLLPPFPGLPTSSPPLPAGREVGVQLSGQGRGGAHARLLRPQLEQRGRHVRGMWHRQRVCRHLFPSHRTPFTRGWEPNGARTLHLCMASHSHITLKRV